VIIEGFQPIAQEGRWRWRSDFELGFTAKSDYQNLILLQRPEPGMNQL
ncbi:hypothetical protein L195_g027293, partial [Trifolium pratense]